MKKNITLLLLLLFGQLSFSQTKEFLISPAQGKNYESYYGAVSFLDSRYDSLDQGYILNDGKKVSLILAASLNKQLQNYLESVVDTSVSKGRLILQLRKFKVVENRDVDFEYGYCFFRASIFAVSGNSYFRIGDTDTLITLRGGDITDTLLSDAEKQFKNLILKGLKKGTAGMLEYSWQDVVHIEEHEKKSIGMYSSGTFSNGIYLSFHSFKNQRPDYTNAVISYKWNGAVKVKVKDKEGKALRLAGKDIFAFVEKEIAYVVPDQGACIVERKNGNLFYVARDKVTPENEEYALSASKLESLGINTASALKANPARENYGYFLSCIDPIDGTFMKVKRIK